VLHDGQTPNGTFVDGVARIEYVLKGGERITCGSTVILFLLLDASPDSLPLMIDDEADRNPNLLTLRAYSTPDAEAAYVRDIMNALLSFPKALKAISDF
jgi:hypothetical protein